MISNDPGERRFICVYETPLPNSWRTGHVDRKAIMVFDQIANASLPFGFQPDYLGPDEDEVVGIVCLIDVTGQDDPTIVIDDVEWRFDLTGKAEKVEA